MENLEKELIEKMSTEQLDALLGNLCSTLDLFRSVYDDEETSMLCNDNLSSIVYLQIMTFEEIRKRSLNHD